MSGFNNYSLVRFPTSGSEAAIDTRVSANGTYKYRGYWRGSGAAPLVLFGNIASSFTMSRPLIKLIDGNHASQTISANRPVLRQDSIGYYAEYDGLSDSLDAYFVTAGGANCTQYKVLLGTVVRTDNVNIPSGVVTLNNVREDIRARIIVNRAPTTVEDLQLRRWIEATWQGMTAFPA